MDIEQPAWIEWTGGDCPVAPGTDCEVRFRNGYTSRDDDPEEWEWNRQSECRDYEIIAYRVWQTAWQAQALAAGWSPSTAPDLATVPAFESGQESMRAENERLRDALRAFENAACMVNQWRSTLAVWVDGTVDHEQWRSLNDTFDKLQAARATARQAIGDPT